MKARLDTVETLGTLKALHLRYKNLAVEALDKYDGDKMVMYRNKAEGVADAIHEIELLSGAID